MAKIKYYYDTKTLSYKRIELNAFDKLKRSLTFLSVSAFAGFIMIIVFFQFFVAYLFHPQDNHNIF